jgi:hypothetical protein
MAFGTVFVSKEQASSLRLTNTSGADIAQFEFAVLAGHGLVADEAVASAAVGGFSIMTDRVFHIDKYVTGEATFGTANAAVYWKPTTGEFSNTSTSGYYLIGYVAAIKAGTVTKVVGVAPKLI